MSCGSLDGAGWLGSNDGTRAKASARVTPAPRPVPEHVESREHGLSAAAPPPHAHALLARSFTYLQLYYVYYNN